MTTLIVKFWMRDGQQFESLVQGEGITIKTVLENIRQAMTNGAPILTQTGVVAGGELVYAHVREPLP